MTRPIDRIERYYDAVPRPAARVEEIGPFSLFVSTAAPWPYYARPRLGGDPHEFSAAEVSQVRQRQRELRLPEAFEWVQEVSPGLLAAATAAGLAVAELPLQLLAGAGPDSRAVGGTAGSVPNPLVRVRLLDPDDPALAAAQAVASVGFAHGGTAIGTAGTAERDRSVGEQRKDAHQLLRSRIRTGATVVAVAEDATGPIGVGSHQPMDGVTEIVGVATLPAARRRGIGAAITAALVADARDRAVDLIFLSAGSDEVARVYQRVGFERIATACIAEPA
ncbi:MAG: GNAT family N-acetyltransferase [Sporichthyaceae bacterium]|nr:GNAT family N-acetyltransferase [Sporichthyaceae bacterium]